MERFFFLILFSQLSPAYLLPHIPFSVSNFNDQILSPVCQIPFILPAKNARNVVPILSSQHPLIVHHGSEITEISCEKEPENSTTVVNAMSI